MFNEKRIKELEDIMFRARPRVEERMHDALGEGMRINCSHILEDIRRYEAKYDPKHYLRK